LTVLSKIEIELGIVTSLSLWMVSLLA